MSSEVEVPYQSEITYNILGWLRHGAFFPQKRGMDAQAEKKDMCRRSACVSQAYTERGQRQGKWLIYVFFFLFCAMGKEGCSPVFCSGELQRGARVPPNFQNKEYECAFITSQSRFASVGHDGVC